MFEEAKWVELQAHLALVFTKLKELNLSHPWKEPHILGMSYKDKGFTRSKLQRRDDQDLNCFLDLPTTPVARRPVLKLLSAHLYNLGTDFPFRSSKSERLDCLRNPLSQHSSTVLHMCSHIWWILRPGTDTDTGRDDIEFWCEGKKEYAQLGKHALTELLPSDFLSFDTLQPSRGMWRTTCPHNCLSLWKTKQFVSHWSSNDENEGNVCLNITFAKCLMPFKRRITSRRIERSH